MQAYYFELLFKFSGNVYSCHFHFPRAPNSFEGNIFPPFLSIRFFIVFIFIFVLVFICSTFSYFLSLIWNKNTQETKGEIQFRHNFHWYNFPTIFIFSHLWICERIIWKIQLHLVEIFLFGPIRYLKSFRFNLWQKTIWPIGGEKEVELISPHKNHTAEICDRKQFDQLGI